MTLLEVLFAIMVASVGLLAAIALFPVALAMARQGRIADLTQTASHSGIAAFDCEAMRRPDHWLRWDAVNSQTQFLPTNFNQAGSAFFGSAFCIDPMSFSHNAADQPGNWNMWSAFPAVPPAAAPIANRMYRLTLYSNDPTPGLTIAQKALRPMSMVQADKAFRIEDELIFQRPDNNALPAVQLYTPMNVSGTTVPARRQEEGRLTWFATLVPKLDRLHNVLGEEYVLSIVVCHNRANGEALHVNDPANPIHPWNEWTAKILATDFHAGGIGGGEVTITTNDPSQDPTFNSDKYLNLRSGQWVLLGTRIPAGIPPGSLGQIQHFQWYRISDADETVLNVNRWSQDVTLVGGDWPADADGDGTNDDCDVVIVPYVAYVYERTIKIDTGAVP